MGKSSSAEIGTKYLVAWHVNLAKRVDAVLEMRAGDKIAWSGNVSASTIIAINQPQLFGGDKDQGGLVGNLAFMMGEADQEPQPYLTSTFGDHTVAWRGFTTLGWLGGEYGSNNPYPFKMSAKTFSCFEIWDEAPGWYPEKAKVAVGSRNIVPNSVWKYKNVAAGDTTNYSEADASGWIEGQAPFGNGDYSTQSKLPADYGFSNVPNTTVSVDAAIWYRKDFYFDAGSDVSFECFVDDTFTLYVNGVVVHTQSDPLAWGYSMVTIPKANIIAGMNRLAIRQTDTNTALADSYFDCRFTAAGFAINAMNPVHIIVHAHTHSEMARMPIETIDDANARAAADWYYAKGFGINVRQKVANESPADVIRRVERVAGLSFTRDMTTGLYRFYIANGEYDLDSLPILTDDDIVSFKETPTIPDNAVNSVQVKYFDPERKETVITPPLRALGLVSLYGEIQQVFDFPEIPTGGLANLVGLRETLGSITPTRRFDLVAKPTGAASDINKGQYFRLQAPKRGIADMVCILGEKDGGTLKSGNLGLTVAQDVWSLPDTVYSDIEHGIDTRPPQVPVPITDQRAFEAPYIEVCRRLPRAELDALPVDAGFLVAVAADPARSRDFALMVAPSGGAYDESGQGDFCPTALVVEAADKSTEDFTLSGGVLLASVEVGDPVVWGDELCRVDALDTTALTITLGRACADTVPQEHAAGERLFFYRDGAAYDTAEHVDGEAVDVKLLTNTGSRRLDEAAATAMGLEFAGRSARPYPPANVRLNGQAYPQALVLDGDLSIDAYHRDRTLQADQLIDQSMASIGPELGTTYVVRNVDAVTDLETYVADGITTWPHVVPAADLANSNRLEVYSERDGLESFQRVVVEFALGSVLLAEDGDPITTEDGQLITME